MRDSHHGKDGAREDKVAALAQDGDLPYMPAVVNEDNEERQVEYKDRQHHACGDGDPKGLERQEPRLCGPHDRDHVRKDDTGQKLRHIL